MALNVFDKTRFFQRTGCDGLVGQVLERSVSGQLEHGRKRKESAQRQGHPPRVEQQDRECTGGHDRVNKHREGAAHKEVAHRGNRVETGQDVPWMAGR